MLVAFLVLVKIVTASKLKQISYMYTIEFLSKLFRNPRHLITQHDKVINNSNLLTVKQQMKKPEPCISL